MFTCRVGEEPAPLAVGVVTATAEDDVAVIGEDLEVAGFGTVAALFALPR